MLELRAGNGGLVGPYAQPERIDRKLERWKSLEAAQPWNVDNMSPYLNGWEITARASRH